MLECFYWLLGNQTLILIQVKTVFEIHVFGIETMIYQWNFPVMSSFPS